MSRTSFAIVKDDHLSAEVWCPKVGYIPCNRRHGLFKGGSRDHLFESRPPLWPPKCSM